MNAISSARIALAAVSLVVLAGCEERDPLRRTDVWYPTGSNAANIAAMVANPNDLIRGHGANGGDGREAALAVERLWTDKTKPLPQVNDSTGAISGGTGAGGGGGSGSGGGG
jgi:type IV pilus biogenesis protein CpaD/CtpE